MDDDPFFNPLFKRTCIDVPSVCLMSVMVIESERNGAYGKTE